MKMLQRLQPFMFTQKYLKQFLIGIEETSVKKKIQAISIPEKNDQLFIPKYKDTLFWCFYIIHNYAGNMLKSFDNYLI